MNKGFYKNYSTMSPFQFDRIYPNKTTMDANATWDGILIGRYVFVEYGDYEGKNYPNIKNENNEYTFKNGTLAQGRIKVKNGIKTLAEDSNILIGEIYQDLNNNTIYYEVYQDIEHPEEIGDIKYYPLKFKKIETTLLENNIQKDNKENYDSTIWQKIYDKENNTEKYIQIASVDTPVLKATAEWVSPGVDPSVEINFETSPETYVFSLPEAWDIKVKTAEDENYSDEYEGEGIEKRPLNIYYNKKGLKNIDFVKISEYLPDTFYYKEENHLIKIGFDELNSYKGQQIFTNTKPSGAGNPISQNVKVKDDNGNIDSTEDVYLIKLLEDNEYLWDDIKDSSNFYTLTDPTLLIKENLISFSNLDQVVFYYKGLNVEDYTFINFSENEDRIAKIGELLDEGYSVIYFEFDEIKQSNFNCSSNYYDSNFKQITVIENQNAEKPYYFKAKEDYQYFIFKEGQPVKDSNGTQTAGRDYYEDQELKNPVILKNYAPKTFYRKNNPGQIQGIYEKVGEDCYYLAYEENAINDIEYYEKISYFEKNETLENKINLETDTIEGAKELSLILPGLGNIAADIYNLFYNDGKEEKSTTIYSSIEKNENLYNGEEPLYNVNTQSVVGMINTIYDTIGRMKIVDKPAELNEDNLKDYNLTNTLFKDNNEYYLIVKCLKKENGQDKWVYETELFNQKSLYHLIAEMQHLISGSYEGFFNALDKKLWFQTDDHIAVVNVVDAEEERVPLSYLIKHNSYFENEYEKNIKLATGLDCENNEITYKNYSIDEAGHVNKTVPEDKVIYMPAAFVGFNEPDKNTTPVGSIWYKTEG